MGLEQTDGYSTGDHFASEVISSLEENKWDVSNPIPLVFYLYLPSEDDANSCVDRLESASLDVSVEESAGKDERWLCLCKKKMIPEKNELTSIGNLLLELANEKNGELDGWETDISIALKRGCRNGCLRIVILSAILTAIIIYFMSKR